MQNDVMVVAHHGIGTDIDAEHRAEEKNAIFYPLAPMFITVTGLFIKATKKGAADAPGGAVVVGRSIEGY